MNVWDHNFCAGYVKIQYRPGESEVGEVTCIMQLTVIYTILEFHIAL